MKNSFQIILVGIFVVILVLGVLLFAGVIGPKPGSSSSSKVVGTAIIWGTLPQSEINNVLSRLYAGKSYNVRYIQKPESSYREAILEAFSSGTGPDLFMVTDQDFYSFESKLIPFSYKQLSQRDFRNLFVTEGEIFASPVGYSAIPFLIDPLVLYWNRGIFDSFGIPTPPSTWQDVIELTPRLTKKTDSGLISQSAVSIGFMDNVLHRRDILSLLLFQQGSSISKRTDFSIEPTFHKSDSTNISPAEQVLDFMKNFTDPLSLNYTWNRALNLDKDRFIASQLALYLGTASELFEIQSKNPNLNFDVAFAPQIKNSNIRVTYGKLYGIAVSKFSSNSKVAYQAIYDLISQNFQQELSSAFSLPPVRRDLLTQKPENPYASVFFDSSLSARGWLDPNYQKTNQIFKSMYDAYFSNSLDARAAVGRAASDFSILGLPL